MSRGSLHSLKAIAENGTMSNGQQSLNNVVDRYNTPKHVLYLQFVRKKLRLSNIENTINQKSSMEPCSGNRQHRLLHVVDALGLDFNVCSAFCGQFGNVG